jgi:cobalt-zinc-cadmium efflux system outer membrane protein
MSPRRLLLLPAVLLLSGCLWPVREKTDHAVADLAAHALDVAPDLPPSETTARPTETPAAPAPKKEAAFHLAPSDLNTTAFLADPPTADKLPDVRSRINLNIPTEVPGSEAPLVQLPPQKDKEALKAAVRKAYPELPPLAEAPTPLPGPDGRAYTLADLQKLATENSPTLRQAASDVQAAKGNVLAARAYPNPTFAFEQDPNNASTSAGAFGFYVEQVIKTMGKLKLASAAAEMDLLNAELALRRARSDLATQVRTAYFGLLVADETVRVNRALARFTDDVYRIQAELLESGFAANYEPATLRAQAYTARLAYKQSITNYLYAWKQLVTAIGLRQLPLTAVAGRVDRLLPNYDFDAVLAHALKNHTDVLTARHGVEKARYNLKLAQVTPIPDVTVHVAAVKETTLPPFTWYTGVQVGVPVPIWDQNKGPIIAAQAALERALEEPHRVELNLTNTLSNAYTNYKNNLDALEFYRRDILPDQVRYYRGVFERRRVDQNSAFGDLVTAQQTLAASVSTYLGLLGQMWTSVVQVADLLQTDDLFQVGNPRELPDLPGLDGLTPWPCPHPAGSAAGAAFCGPMPLTAVATPQPTPVQAASAPVAAQPAGPALQPVPAAAPKPRLPQVWTTTPLDPTAKMLLEPPPTTAK